MRWRACISWYVGAENEDSGPTSSQTINVNDTERQPATANEKRELYHAARTGDWKTVERIVRSHQEIRKHLLRLPVLSSTTETALHIAAGANQVGFVEKFLNEFGNNEPLNAADVKGNTVLCTAAAVGSYKIVKKLLSTPNNVDLPLIRGAGNMTPACIAAMFGRGAIASALYNVCIDLERDPQFQLERRQPILSDEEKISLFFTCIKNEIFDLALKLLIECPDLFLESRRDFNSETALHLLARNPSVFSSQRQGIWNQLFPRSCFFTSSCKASSVQSQASKFLKALLRKLSEQNENVFQDVIRNRTNILFDAAASGNYTLLAILFWSFPDLIWERNADRNLIFHTAILKRNIKIFKLVHETGLVRNVLIFWEDQTTGDNILHFAAKLAPDDILAATAGEAFQLAKEVSMFKEVERLVPASYRYKKNADGKTPWELFTVNHHKMLKEAEEWMKKKASYVLIVSTLIVTVVFPAAFTLPQGKETIHLKKELEALAIINAIALGLSTFSIIMFVSILISRYAEVNFISSLPKSFQFGLFLFFLSLLFSLGSFSLVTYVYLKTI